MIVKTLIKNGAYINSRDFEGRTPLHVAVINKAKETMLYLLLEGAQLYKKDHQGKLPRDYTKNMMMLLIFQKMNGIYAVHLFQDAANKKSDIRKMTLEFFLKELINYICWDSYKFFLSLRED